MKKAAQINKRLCWTGYINDHLSCR